MGTALCWDAGASHCGTVSRGEAPGARASVVAGGGTWALELGLRALWHAEPSWTRDRTCIGRWILIHCTTWGVLRRFFVFVFVFLIFLSFFGSAGHLVTARRI